MKNATNIGMLAAVVFAVGMVGINFSDGTIALQNEASTPTEGGSLLGHIEVIHTDDEGNILSYMQTDNAIVQDGRNCTAMLLFGNNGECRAQSPGGLSFYDVIGIGNGTALAGTTDITELQGEIDELGLVRTQDTSDKSASYTNATGNDGAGVQRITAQFTWTGPSTNTVNQAGLFNQTTAGATSSTFALKNFPSAVAMNTNDQLTVNWDITIDGSSAYS